MLETIGQYKVLEQIGTGGIGDIFRARDTRLGRTVSLELVSSSIASHPERRAEFLRDAKAASALSHPNIASVYEVIEDHDLVYLAREFVPGEPLARLAGGRGLNPRRAIDFAIQIADALAEAHALDTQHGDLTSANIIITPKGTVKIVNCGLARWSRRDGPPNGDDDVLSIGKVIFEMITGHSFDPERPAILRPISVGREVPAELDPIVARMLTTDRTATYQSPATAAADLRALKELLDERSTTTHAQPLPTGRPAPSDWRWLFVILAVAVIAAIGWVVLNR